MCIYIYNNLIDASCLKLRSAENMCAALEREIDFEPRAL